MLSLASRKQGWIIFILWNISKSMTCVFLIKLLSEWITWVEWYEWDMLSGYIRPSDWQHCVSHLWKATKEQRDLRCLMLRSFKCSHMAYGLCLDKLGCKNSARWTVGGRVDRMERVHGGLRECFWKVSSWCMSSLVGKVHHLSRG